jgi:hypothetical protein
MATACGRTAIGRKSDAMSTYMYVAMFADNLNKKGVLKAKDKTLQIGMHLIEPNIL